ncbi:MAG: peptide ABC transporter substrate-binding protein [Chlamydiales bacterium]
MKILPKKTWTIVLFLLLFLISCQQLSNKGTQMLSLNFQDGDVPTLHPHLLEGHMRGRVLGKALFEGLTRINSEGEAELAGAESVKISPSKTQYTFILRDHKWSDGSVVTAFQYEKAWKQAIAPLSDCTRADLFYVIKEAEKAKKGILSLNEVGVKALDEKTLSVELTFPTPYFLKLIASPLFAPVIRNGTEPTRFNGPFKVHKWKRNSLLVLKANPFFWDSSKVSLSEIEIQMVDDPLTTLLMYEKQKIDWIGSPFCKLSSETIFQLQEKGELQNQPVARFLGIYINTSQPFLASSKIRQALSLSIDRSLISKHIDPGSSPLYQPLPSSFSLSPNLFSDNDIAQAKKLFEEGLQEIKSAREIFPFLTLNYPNAACCKPLAEYLKERWKKTLGIEIKLEGTEWNILRSHLEKGTFQMGMCVSSALYPDPSEFLERFASIKAANFPQWEHPIYQEKLDLAKKQPEQRIRYLREAEELLFEQMPFIPICNSNALYVHNPRLKGYVFDHNGCVDFRWAYVED